MVKRPFYTLVALLALASLCALPGSVAPVAWAQPAGVSFFGLNTYFTGLERHGRDGDAGVATLVDRGRQIGAAWAREELSWANLERDGRGRWSWEYYDRRLLAAAEGGYGIVGMLLTTPAWARVSDCAARTQRYASAGVRALDYWCPPARAQDFADYVRAVVERYDGDGQDDAPGSPRVGAWQIWNEPNHWETWPGSAAEYAAILQAGYAAAKAADPAAIVATGGLYVLDGAWSDGVGHQDGLRFLGQALAARPAAWASFDALAVHPYMPDSAPDQPGLYGAATLWGRLTTARAWLDERTRLLGGEPRPLWVSELGWSTCSAAEADCYVGGASSGLATLEVAGGAQVRVFPGPSAAHGYVAGEELEWAGAGQADEARIAALIGKSEQQQANYLVRAHAIALALGVQHMSWFQLEDKFDGSARNFWEEAAIFRTAAQGYGPKPAAVAYAALTAQLAGMQFEGFGPLHSFRYSAGGASPTARFHLRFRSDDNRRVELIWRNAGSEEVRLALEPGVTPALFSRDGAPLALPVEAGSARLTIGEAPIYLQQNLPPALGLSQGQLTLLARPGDGPQPVEIGLRNLGSGSLSWSATVDAPWAQLETPAGQGYSSRLRLTITPAGLAPAIYTSTLRINSSGGAREVPLRLIVDPGVQRGYLPLVAR
ncbi:MAG: hypothetical protein OHK0015_14500 [Chloroflexi bacterium OHK40]